MTTLGNADATARRRFKPYAAYKDAGVQSLEVIPTHWEAKRLGHLGTFSKGNGGSKEDEVPEGIPCVRYGDLYTTHEFFIHRSRRCVAPERASDYTPITYGDLLFAASGETFEEIGKSAVNLIRSDARCGGDVILFRPTVDIEPRFLGYATNSPSATAQKASMGRGTTIKHIDADHLKDVSIAVPAIPEQASIADFLDRETARIDALVAKKGRLIELLIEKRTALVTRAVTSGLDSDVRLQDSGVEWLGEIPEGWQVLPNAALFRQRDLRGRRDLPILEVSIAFGVQAREFAETRIERQASDPATYKIAQRGDVAFNKMRMWQGAVGVAPEDGLVSSDYIVAEPTKVANPTYYAALFRTANYMAEVYRYSHGIADDRNRLYWDDFKSIESPVPPRLEQEKIVRYIDAETRESMH